MKQRKRKALIAIINRLKSMLKRERSEENTAHPDSETVEVMMMVDL